MFILPSSSFIFTMSSKVKVRHLQNLVQAFFRTKAWVLKEFQISTRSNRWNFHIISIFILFCLCHFYLKPFLSGICSYHSFRSARFFSNRWQLFIGAFIDAVITLWYEHGLFLSLFITSIWKDKEVIWRACCNKNCNSVFKWVI